MLCVIMTSAIVPSVNMQCLVAVSVKFFTVMLCVIMPSAIVPSVNMQCVVVLSVEFLMRLCHPPDGSTSPKYKLL
jgi:hypothetical protein